MDTIVVGVDESDGARHALEWAVAEAGVHRARLVVVHAYQPLSSYYGYSALEGQYLRAGIEDEARQAAEAFLRSVLAELSDGGAAVQLEPVVTRGRASEALLEQARDADLVVVGSRGWGGFTGLLLGSVSQQVVHHAPCPVVVVPKAARPG